MAWLLERELGVSVVHGLSFRTVRKWECGRKLRPKRCRMRLTREDMDGYLACGRNA